MESQQAQEKLKLNEPFVIAHWHGDELGLVHLVKRYNSACIVSTSKDGNIMSRVIELLGATTTRGSSTRKGAQALKGLLRLSKKGYRPTFAVDGPKGPRHQVKPGVFQVSRLAGLPIFPLSFSCSKSKVFEKAWNKAELPLPFSKVTICLGEPLPVVDKGVDVRSSALMENLSSQLHLVKDQAQKHLENP